MNAKAYAMACESYQQQGVDPEVALSRLATIPISVHSWQGDDVQGFDQAASPESGLAVTGTYPGRARNGDELRADLDQALRLLPGPHRVNLQAMHAEATGRPVDRDALEPAHFARWIDWARDRGLQGMDFNPSCFGHPMAADGLTLAHPREAVRAFWIRHVRACRTIGAAMGRALGSPTVSNIWVPDGSKELPVDTRAMRERLCASLDAALSETLDPVEVLDAVEGKLFGIGLESFTAGSHEFYLAYAVRRGILLCIDTGHYHPTEAPWEKLSAVLTFLEGVMLHVSRGVRWDSDHVVLFSDDVLALCRQIVRHDYLGRAHLGLDFFDASINRVAAWVIGGRNLRKALLAALLEPIDALRQAEADGDFTRRLALQEVARTAPLGAVWDEFCRRQEVPLDADWLEIVRRYERAVLSQRDNKG